MKEQDAGRSAVLLEALALVNKEAADEITQKWSGVSSLEVSKIYLPADVWTEVLGAIRTIVLNRLQELGIDVTEAPK